MTVIARIVVPRRVVIVSVLRKQEFSASVSQWEHKRDIVGTSFCIGPKPYSEFLIVQHSPLHCCRTTSAPLQPPAEIKEPRHHDVHQTGLEVTLHMANFS